MNTQLEKDLKDAIEGAMAEDLGDNLAIYLATFFQDLPACPLQSDDDDGLWNRWALEHLNEVFNDAVKRVVEVLDCHINQDEANDHDAFAEEVTELRQELEE